MTDCSAYHRVRKLMSALLVTVVVTILSVVALPRPAAADQYSWCFLDCTYAGTVYFMNDKTGQCLAIGGGSTANGAKAIEWPCEGITNQAWNIYTGGPWPLSPEDYIFQNVATGKCLAVPNGSITAGLGLIQWPCEENASQTWFQDDARCEDGGACVSFRSEASNLVFAVPGGSQTKGTQIVQWREQGTREQIWLEEVISVNV